MTSNVEDENPRNELSIVNDIFNDITNYVKNNKIEVTLLVCGIIFILYPHIIPSKYKPKSKTTSGSSLLHGGNNEGNQSEEEPTPSTEMGRSTGSTNSVINKVKDGIERIGSALLKALSVIGSMFLVIGLVSLPFIIYAIVFYFIIKRGFNVVGAV